MKSVLQHSWCCAGSGHGPIQRDSRKQREIGREEIANAIVFRLHEEGSANRHEQNREQAKSQRNSIGG